MTMLRLASITAVLLLLLSPSVQANDTAEWPGFRGPQNPPTDAFPSDSFGLAVEWQRELGSGYSSFAIAGDHVVTQFTAGDDDVLAAIRSTDGEEIWRYRMAAKYAGHDGSDDGPLATPAVAGDHVVALGASGELVAVSLRGGKERWRVQLDESNSSVPFYGYTSSPLVIDDLVVLATGGDGRAVTAFDLATGKVRWNQGDDTATYQSAIVTELAGHRQIVATTDHFAYGLDPDGTLLWQYKHSENARDGGSAHPTAVDGHHVLVNLDSGSLLLKVTADGGWTATEAWTSRAFGNSLVLPVVHDGHIYGFTGRILTCVDAATGDIRWRSRGAAGFNLSLVDGHLVVLTANDGEVVVIEADAQEYKEKARIAVFERGDYADAAFADGRFFVRNLSHIAAFRVDGSAAAGVAEQAEDPHRISGAIGALVTELLALPATQRQARVDSFFEGKALPMVETTDAGKGLAHFVYRGDVEDVAVSGTFLGPGGAEQPLHRVPETDLFYRSFELDPAGQWEYQLSVDYGRGGPDAANPFPTLDQGFALFSELRMPAWPASPHVEEPAEGTPRGALDTFQFNSEILGNTRQIQVWRPAGYNAQTSYPVLVMNHGDRALREGVGANVLDRIVGHSVEPLVVVFVPRAAGPEYGGPATGDYVRFLTEELLPHVDRHYSTQTEGRAIMGPGSGGTTAVYAALHAPDAFPRAAAQSFYLAEAMREPLFQQLADADKKPEHVYVEWSHHDYDVPANGIDAAADSKMLLEKLKEKGIDTTEDVVSGAAGWGSWRAQTHKVLETLFPLQSE